LEITKKSRTLSRENRSANEIVFQRWSKPTSNRQKLSGPPNLRSGAIPIGEKETIGGGSLGATSCLEAEKGQSKMHKESQGNFLYENVKDDTHTARPRIATAIKDREGAAGERAHQQPMDIRLN